MATAQEIVFSLEIDNRNSIKNMKELIDRQKELKKAIALATDKGSEGYEELRQEIKANQKEITEFNRDLRNSAPIAQRVSEGVTKSFKQVGSVIAGAFALNTLGDFAQEVIELTSTIEDGFARVNTVAQLSADDLEKLKDQAIAIGKEGGSELEKIPDALFDIISGTGDTELSLKLLETSVKATDAGFGDLGTTATAGVNILNAVGREAISTNELFDVLFATQKEGVVSFDELSKVLPNVIPSAKAVGFSFQETSSALATLTKQGLDATSAGTSLRAFFSTFSNKAKLDRLNSTLERVGSSVFDADGKLRGLTDIVTDFDTVLSQATSDEERAAILGDLNLDQNSVKALQGLTSGLEDFTAVSASIGDASSGLGELQKQLELSENGTRSLNQANNSFKAELLELGQKVVPGLESAQIKLYEILERGVSILNSTIEFFEENEAAALILKNTLLALGTVISLNVVNRLVDVAQKAEVVGRVFTLLRNPLGTVIGLFSKFTSILRANPIGVLVTGITLAITAWEIFNSETEKAGGSVKEFSANSEALKGTVNDLNKELSKEITNSNKLFEVLKSDTASREEKERVMQQINDQYGDYLPSLLTEKQGLEDIERAQNAVNAALTRTFTLKIQEATQADALTEKIKTQQAAFEELQKTAGDRFTAANFTEFQQVLEGLASSVTDVSSKFQSAVNNPFLFNSDDLDLGNDRLNKFTKSFNELANEKDIEFFLSKAVSTTRNFNQSINSTGQIINNLAESTAGLNNQFTETPKVVKKSKDEIDKGAKEIEDRYKKALDQIKETEQVQIKESEATFIQRKQFLTELLDNSNLTEQQRFNLIKSLSDQEKILKTSVRDATKKSLTDQLNLAKEFNKDSELLVAENNLSQQKNESTFVNFVIEQRVKLDNEQEKISKKEIERSLIRLQAEAETAEREINLFKEKFKAREDILRESGVSEEQIQEEKNKGISAIVEKFAIESLNETERIEQARLQIEFNEGEQSVEQKEAFEQAKLKATLKRQQAELKLLQDLGNADEARILELKASISGISSQIQESLEDSDVTFKDFSNSFSDFAGKATEFTGKLQTLFNQSTELALQGLDRQSEKAQLKIDGVQEELNNIDERIANANASQRAALIKEKKEIQQRFNEEQEGAEKLEAEKEKIRKEAFERNKTFAILTAVVNGAVAITKSIADLGPIAGAIAAVTTGVITATQVALIASQKFALGGLIESDSDRKYVNVLYARGGSIPMSFPAKRGGMIKGPSHKRGGVPFSVKGKPGFEAQGGEFISSTPTTRMFYPVLSAMNTIGNRLGNNSASISNISRVPPSRTFELGGQIPNDVFVTRDEFQSLLKSMEFRDSKLEENQRETNDLLRKMKLTISLSEVQDGLTELANSENSDDD